MRSLPCLLLVLAAPAAAADLTLDLGAQRTITTEELLARPDVATITVPDDASYSHAMTYSAVSLLSLPGAAPPEGEDVSLNASDGFVTSLPGALVVPPGAGKAVHWLAIERPDAPWPPTPEGKATGPFYLVELAPAASGVLREQWPFAVVAFALALVPDTAARGAGARNAAQVKGTLLPVTLVVRGTRLLQRASSPTNQPNATRTSSRRSRPCVMTSFQFAEIHAVREAADG